VDRVAWDDLPAELKEAITARTGQITAIRTPGAGLNSPLAVIITAENGTWSLWLPNTDGITQDLSTTVNSGETLTMTFWGGDGERNRTSDVDRWRRPPQR